MLTLSRIRLLDRSWLATLGLLGACGPNPPAVNGTGSTSAGTSSGDDLTTTSGSTSGSTSGPTTGPMTMPSTVTEPMPECIDDVDCRSLGTCFCFDGHCEPCHEQYECGYGYGDNCGPGYVCANGECLPDPYYYECSSDDDCDYGYLCEVGSCVPSSGEPTMLRGCRPVVPDVGQWDLAQTPGALALADVDGDGDLDAVAALPAVAAIELAFNDGAGVFTPGDLVDVGPPLTEMRVASGDLDGDGDVDLAVARADSSDLVVVFGEAGLFVPGPILTASATPRTITAADLNADGKLDLMTIGGDFGSVSAWTGDGMGGFGAEKHIIDLTDSILTTVQDVGQSPEPDLLALRIETLRIYRGGPNVSWVFDEQKMLDAPTWTQALGGDLGGDPAPELVAMRVDGIGGAVRVWPGTGPLSWGTPKNYTSSSPLHGGALADGDGDGELDLLAATGVATISVLVGNGTGGFACERVHAVGLPTAPEVLAAGELDGDAGVEVLVGSRDGPTVWVLKAL